MKTRLYHLYVLSSKGAKVYLTAYPDTHRHCEIIASKQSDITRPKVCFEEVEL